MTPTSVAVCPARMPCGATPSRSSPATCSSRARARSWRATATGRSACRPTRSSGSSSGRCTRPSARRTARTRSRTTSRCSPTRPARSSRPPRSRASSSRTDRRSTSSRSSAFGEKVGVAFQLLDDVIDLSADPDETGKVPGTDLRAGVPTMPYLRARTADGCRIRSPSARASTTASSASPTGADPAILDAELAELREHEATQATLDLAHAWSREAVDALAPLPEARSARRSRASRRPSRIDPAEPRRGTLSRSVERRVRDTKGPS